MSRHTKGPWCISETQSSDHDFEIRPTFRGHAERDSRGRVIGRVTPQQCFPSYRPIATVKHDKRLDISEAIANAHLIAAAPDLFSGAEELIANLKNMAIHPSHYAALEAAIAKATGAA